MRAALALTAFILAAAGSAQPMLSAQSALVMDADTGRILWSKDPDSKRFPASTTKIMTALLILENADMEDDIRAPMGIDKVTGSSMHLKPFERVKVRHMLTAIMLRSANDGCVASAMQVGGSVEQFAEMMNTRAKQIGCTSTHFVNPHGLHDEQHYTTAHDLALIAREAMKNETFRGIVRQQRAVIERSVNQEDRLMINRDKFLAVDPTAGGIKTGYTDPAGKCFVGYVDRPEGRIITVVLKCEDWLKDQQMLVEWAYNSFRKTPVVQKDDVIGHAPVKNGAPGEVKVVADGDYTPMATGSVSAPKLSHINLTTPLTAPVPAGKVVGTATMISSEIGEFEVPVRTAEDIKAIPPAVHVMRNPVAWAGALALVVGAMGLKSRRTRIARNQRRRARKRR